MTLKKNLQELLLCVCLFFFNNIINSYDNILSKQLTEFNHDKYNKANIL